VEISYTPHSAAPLEEQVAAAAAQALERPDARDVLVFLPGAAEIRRAAQACERLVAKHDISILPLHGSLSAEEQHRAVQPADCRKLILSTNVAESSITIDGVNTVIDSGLARIASDSPETGLPTLQVQRISKASAVQRAGRAGRLGPGRAIRLYTVEDYHRRRDHDTPEIQRRELSQVVLSLRSLGVSHVDWFEAPPDEALKAAADLLDRLTSHENPRELAKYPLHPRLARLLVESRKRGVIAAACRVAAILTSGERYAHTDVIHLLDLELPYGAQQIYNQLIRISGARRDHGSDDDLRTALLTAFPDRVARRRSATDAQLCSGRPALLPAGWQSGFLAAIDLEDRRENQAPIIRLACAIQSDWLLDLFPERIRETRELIWKRQAERVESVSSLIYDSMPIAETHGVPTDVEGAARLLADRALEAGLHRFADPVAIEGLLARIEFASSHSELPALTNEGLQAALADLCHGIRSFEELQKIASQALPTAILRRLGPNAERTLNEIAPERVFLKDRQVKVHYRPLQQPYIASRLQDFFGIHTTPRIARGQMPLLVHLLAPNQRPVQVTSDLARFWEKLYPQVRKELSRKYPKHSWPERPG
jgi:ATP-dependent helicase HrpB